MQDQSNNLNLLTTTENIIKPDLEKDTTYNNILSLVLIIKNGATYIKEWIEFHRIVGVDHFYIYDNESSDNLIQEIYDYIENGIVTYTYWPGKVVQLSAYNDAINRYKNNTKYLGFIDSDEYIIPIEGESIVKIVDYIFDNYENCGGLGVSWRMYGSSFHEKKVDGLVLENYKYRADDKYVENKHIKTICNPRVVTGFYIEPHSLSYIPPYHCVSENGVNIDGPFYESDCSKIRINHYHLKSKEDYYEKRKRGWPSRISECPSDDVIERDFTERDLKYNKIYDTTVDKYILELKRRCGLI